MAVLIIQPFILYNYQHIQKHHSNKHLLDYSFSNTINLDSIFTFTIYLNHKLFKTLSRKFFNKKGIEITAISKRLGHKNSQITLSTYAHFYDDKTDKIIDLLNTIE